MRGAIVYGKNMPASAARTVTGSAAVSALSVLCAVAREVKGASAQATSAARDGRSVKSAAKDFEALFATMLVKEMRKALPEGFFGGEAEGDVYGGWFDEQLGRKIAEGGALHLADTLEASFIKRAAPSTDASASSASELQRAPNSTQAPAMPRERKSAFVGERGSNANTTSTPEAKQ